MPKLICEHSHSLASVEAQSRMRSLLDHFGVKYRFTTDWVGDGLARVRARGMTGQVTVGAQAVRFDLDLSFLLSPFRSRIEEGIRREVQRAFA
ncbi:MAG: polyhydroxyalkanoic acid system family protein [Deltaproteobacteria bacterium]|nr:polyhydroxyalkanoic acid system family protein [Deltaproteobacteria bacterium]